MTNVPASRALRRNDSGQVLNVAGTPVNPSTEEKQDVILAAIQSLLTKKSFSTGNKTSTPLAGGATFTGAWEDVSNYIQTIITINVDQDSAASGVKFEFSDDGITTTHSHIWSIMANYPNGHHYPQTLDSKYFRVVYTNGAVAQTNFLLEAVYFTDASEEGHTHAVEYVIDGDHPAPIVRAVLVGKNAAGTYANVALTNGDNLKVSVEELETAVQSFFTGLDLRTDMEGGGYVTVGTTAVELTFTGTTNTIHVESKITNTGTIWLGKSNVTSAGANSFASLQPGESIDLRYNDATNALYAVSDTAAQSVLKGALL